MKRLDAFALLISLLALLVSAFVSLRFFEGIPHIEDEITFVWQARLAARGNLTIASPVCPKCFLEPFVIDYNGVRFGKYPPGWPALLSLGERLGVRQWINPILAAFYTWLNYLLVKRLFDEKTGIIASLLTVISPFFLMGAGSLLAHTWSLLLVVAFAHAWLDLVTERKDIPRWMSILCAGVCLGLLGLTRPLTAAGVGLLFFLHGLLKIVRGKPTLRWNILLVGIVFMLVACLYFVWQYQVTGSFTQNPYTMVWEYDKIGFGPGVGMNTGGHNLHFAWVNTKFSLRVGFSDFFGWPGLSWIFLPFGFIAIRKKPLAWLISSVFFSLVLVYALYWIGAWVLGPRYYYEGLFSLTLLSAAGIRWLAGGWQNIQTPTFVQRGRFILVNTILGILLTGNLLFYLPQRLGSLHGLFGISQERLLPFMTQEFQALTPALVIVNPINNWLEYGALLDLSSPYLDSPIVFIYDRGAELNKNIAALFPTRKVVYYSPAEPYRFNLITYRKE